jgi:hypothetical protein
MRFSTRFIVIASVVLTSVFLWGQSQINGYSPTSLLVRMSFTSSWMDDYGPEGIGYPQICFSVDRAGHYQMRRLTRMQRLGKKDNKDQDNGNKEIIEGTPQPELLRGTLPPQELKRLENFLQDPEFRGLARSSGGILRKGAETFVAEVPREDGVQRVVMSDTDRQNPFPHSAARIVNWLQHFKAEGAEALDVSAQDICPSGALQPVNPATSSVQPISTQPSSSSGACVKR